MRCGHTPAHQVAPRKRGEQAPSSAVCSLPLKMHGAALEFAVPIRRLCLRLGSRVGCTALSEKASDACTLFGKLLDGKALASPDLTSQ